MEATVAEIIKGVTHILILFYFLSYEVYPIMWDFILEM